MRFKISTNFLPVFAGVIIMFWTTSCTNSKPEHSNDATLLENNNKVSSTKLTLVPKEIIEIPIDSTSINYSPYPVYYANDTCEFYITANEYLNAIDFYDLKKKQLAKRNGYERSGPEGIRSTRRIFIKSLDSIYVYSEPDLKILLTNFAGKVIESYKVPRPWMSHLQQPLTIINNEAFFGFMENGGSREQHGYQTMIKLNLISGKYEPTGPHYPLVLSQKTFWSWIPSHTFGHNNNIVVRYGSFPDIDNYDMKEDTTYQVPMMSVFQDKEILGNADVLMSRDMDRDFEEFEQADYQGVFYDKYNHVYYSLFRPSIPVKNLDGNKHTHYDKEATIIIFNEDFEYCGEIALEKKVYMYNYIPTKRGLMIPRSHPDNPDNNEDRIQFQIFAIEKEN